MRGFICLRRSLSDKSYLRGILVVWVEIRSRVAKRACASKLVRDKRVVRSNRLRPSGDGEWADVADRRRIEMFCSLVLIRIPH